MHLPWPYVAPYGEIQEIDPPCRIVGIVPKSISNDDYILIWPCIAMGPNPHAGLGHDERERLVKLNIRSRIVDTCTADYTLHFSQSTSHCLLNVFKFGSMRKKDVKRVRHTGQRSLVSWSKQDEHTHRWRHGSTMVSFGSAMHATQSLWSSPSPTLWKPNTSATSRKPSAVPRSSCSTVPR